MYREGHLDVLYDYHIKAHSLRIYKTHLPDARRIDVLHGLADNVQRVLLILWESASVCVYVCVYLYKKYCNCNCSRSH